MHSPSIKDLTLEQKKTLIKTGSVEIDGKPFRLTPFLEVKLHKKDGTVVDIPDRKED